MKMLCTFILLLIIFPINAQHSEINQSEIISKPESQSDRRMSKNWMIGASTFFNTKIGSAPFLKTNSLNTQYNWNEVFSFGFRYSNLKDHENSDYTSPPLDPIATGYKNEYNNLHFLTGYAKYYIFKSPFFFIGGIGRNLAGQSRTIDLTYTVNQKNNLYPSDYYKFKQDFSPYYYLLYGFGFDWLFSNGLTLGGEVSIPNSINRKSHRNITILPLTQSGLTVEYFNSFYYNEVLDRSGFNSKFPTFHIWIGYAF